MSSIQRAIPPLFLIKNALNSSIFREQCPCLTNWRHTSPVFAPRLYSWQFNECGISTGERAKNKNKGCFLKNCKPFRENMKGQSLLHVDCPLDSKLCNQRQFQRDGRWPLRGMGAGKGINEHTVFCISKQKLRANNRNEPATIESESTSKHTLTFLIQGDLLLH